MIVIQILKKIRKRIEEEKNKCKKCYIQGPTGPQGLVGTAILDSYASLYEENGNSYMLVANTPNQVEFSKNSQIKIWIYLLQIR